MKNQQFTKEDLVLYAHLMVDDLSSVGFSYARIAKRLNVSSSTMQKFNSMRERSLRDHTFCKLLAFYCRVFFGDYRLEQIERLVNKDIQKYISHIPPNYRKFIYILAKTELSSSALLLSQNPNNNEQLLC